MLTLPIILLLVAVTIAVPAADFNVLHQLQKRAAVCYDADRVPKNLLNPQECIAAIGQMPTTQVAGASFARTYLTPEPISQFSNAAPEGSLFKLPRFFAFSGCNVGVSMVSPLPHHSEYSSWNQIARNAVDLVRECVIRPSVLGRGGTNYAGRSDGILIELFAGTSIFFNRVGSTSPAAHGRIERVPLSVG